jgi:hypothetical protein
MMSWKQYGEGSMRRKHREPLPQEGLDEPFGPPPEEYLYRCPVCGEEMLVNEAIIDVAIGVAKFRGEYTGGTHVQGTWMNCTIFPWEKSRTMPYDRIAL